MKLVFLLFLFGFQIMPPFRLSSIELKRDSGSLQPTSHKSRGEGRKNDTCTLKFQLCPWKCSGELLFSWDDLSTWGDDMIMLLASAGRESERRSPLRFDLPLHSPHPVFIMSLGWMLASLLV